MADKERKLAGKYSLTRRMTCDNFSARIVLDKLEIGGLIGGETAKTLLKYACIIIVEHQKSMRKMHDLNYAQTCIMDNRPNDILDKLYPVTDIKAAE